MCWEVPVVLHNHVISGLIKTPKQKDELTSEALKNNSSVLANLQIGNCILVCRSRSSGTEKGKILSAGRRNQGARGGALGRTEHSAGIKVCTPPSCGTV
jgi:hypothetical protein